MFPVTSRISFNRDIGNLLEAIYMHVSPIFKDGRDGFGFIFGKLMRVDGKGNMCTNLRRKFERNEAFGI